MCNRLYYLPYLLHCRNLHYSSSEKFTDCTEFIMAPSQCVQEHVVSVSAFILRLPDCTNGIIVFLALRTLDIDVITDVQALLVEAMLAQEMYCWEI